MNKIRTIAQCSILVNENSRFYNNIDLVEARFLVEKIAGLKDESKFMRTEDISIINSRFINLFKSGQVEEANKIIAGCLQKCSNRLDELIEYDGYKTQNKPSIYFLFLDALRWGQVAQYMINELKMYNTTGRFYRPKFKTDSNQK
jgi:hypothetical protein